MNKTYKIIKNNLVYYFIYLLFIIEVRVDLMSKHMIEDESFTYNMIHHSFSNIINLTAQDVHPFLYYFIGKLFTYNITSMYLQVHILRIVSALPYLVLLIIGNVYIKNKFSKLTSILFMICMISMPLLIDNMYTIRMYGWATLFVTIVYLLFISAYKNNRIEIFMLISLFSILSAYTHYYALITVFILYMLFLILFIIRKKKIKYLIFSIVINILLYLPWVKILLNQTTDVSKNFWTSRLQLNDVIKMFIISISPVNHLSIFYILPLILLICIIITILNKNIQYDKVNIIGLLTPYLLIIIGSILSIIMGHTVILIRYITPAMGIFWLAFSIFIDSIDDNHKTLKCIIINSILLISILSYGKINKYVFNSSNQFDQTLKIYNNIPNNSAIIYDDTQVMSEISNYLNNNYTLIINNPVYGKVLNNFNEKNDVSLPSQYKNIYYIKTNNEGNELIKKFNDKYINNKKEYPAKNIYLPMEYTGKITMYKIK